MFFISKSLRVWQYNIKKENIWKCYIWEALHLYLNGKSILKNREVKLKVIWMQEQMVPGMKQSRKVNDGKFLFYSIKGGRKQNKMYATRQHSFLTLQRELTKNKATEIPQRYSCSYFIENEARSQSKSWICTESFAVIFSSTMKWTIDLGEIKKWIRLYSSQRW